MSLYFGSAGCAYHNVRPMRMRRKVLTLPARAGATSVEVRHHGREPVRFGGAIRLTAATLPELRNQLWRWENEQGRLGAIRLSGESLSNVRLLKVRFSAPRRVVGSALYVCVGIVEFRQEIS